MLNNRDRRPFFDLVIFRILDNKIGRSLRGIIFIMLCEKKQRFLLLISQYMSLLFLKIIQPLLTTKDRNKIDHYFLSFRINLFRNPISILNQRDKTLRVCITYRCNLRCKYCYASGLTNEMPMDMNLNNFNRLVIWAKNSGFLEIRFLGGEPTIHPQFIEMLEICYRKRMFVSIATNNLFLSQIISKLERFWLRDIPINYILGTLKDDSEKKALFKRNLEQLNRRKIPFGFIYILGSQLDENWIEIFEDAEIYRPRYISLTLSIPGLVRETSISEILSKINSITNRIYKMQEICIKLGIPLIVYRPLLLCMFSQEEWQKLRNAYRFVIFSRCPVGYRDNYARMLVVNPDLSIFPCVSVFIKGPNIFSFKDRNSISEFYKKKLKSLLSRPSMELCKDCNAHRKFVSSLGENKRLDSSFDDGLCQGGCLSFKEEAQSLCHME